MTDSRKQMSKQDNTELSSRELADLVEDLRKENQYYRDLLKVVSHEIKNTATSIHGYNRVSRNYLLKNDLVSTKTVCDDIDRLSMVLYGLCETLYYLTLSNEQDISKSRKPFDLFINALNPVLDELREEYNRKQVKIKVDSPADGVLFLGEDRLFRVVFRNILKNSLIFSDEGKQIQISLKRKKNEIEIQIQNHGPGFSPDECETLFDQYANVLPQIRKSPGYNLFIVRRIIELHDGSIHVQRIRKEHMRFTIKLPIMTYSGVS